MRDDFTKTTVGIIASRAGYRCSNPACRRATTKADPVDECNFLNLGIASHIKAASTGGPRYDSIMTPEERKNAQNGIWLCTKCAREIDASPEAYPVETLLTWKRQAEEVTARDAASTPDGIAEAVNTIEKTINLIHEFIDVWSQNDPVFKPDFSNFGGRIKICVNG
ncbi:MAG: hypothetical protein APF84_17370 [Gracilibacter sp. BRH_c7a]|nr:MAG: hypothetical protein APF84_17370 [Gracilibacter sp. BRH_c7a]